MRPAYHCLRHRISSGISCRKYWKFSLWRTDKENGNFHPNGGLRLEEVCVACTCRPHRLNEDETSLVTDIHHWRTTRLIADYDGCQSDPLVRDDPHSQGLHQGQLAIEAQKMLEYIQFPEDILETPSTPSNGGSSQRVRAGKRPASSSTVRSAPKKAKKETSAGCDPSDSRSGEGLLS